MASISASASSIVDPMGMYFSTAFDTSVNLCFLGSVNFELILRISTRSCFAATNVEGDTLTDESVGSVFSSAAIVEALHSGTSAIVIRANVRVADSPFVIFKWWIHFGTCANMPVCLRAIRRMQTRSCPLPNLSDRPANVARPADRRYLPSVLMPFGQDLYFADGPPVSFFGFPYPTRMAVARLATGEAWVWSPIALTRELADAVAEIGPVSYIVSPNKLHHLALQEWRNRWPGARLYAPPGLARKLKQLRFDSTLGEKPEGGWRAEIDQTVFRGSIAMDEVVFFHRPSRTAIFGDLIQRFSRASAIGWKGMLMRLDGLVGPHGSTPREWRLSFLSRRAARLARRRVIEWNPERLLVAHGECAVTDATSIIAESLSWI